jgi:DNA-3-methyladenine glycosylase
MNDGLLAAEQAIEEYGDHARLSVRILSRTVDVGVPQAGGVQTILLVVEVQVALAGELGHSVRGDRSLGVGLARRELVLLAVDGAAGRGQDHLPENAAAANLQEIEQAADVDIGVEPRVGDRLSDIHLGGVVDQNIDVVVDENAARLLASDVADMKLAAGRDVLLAAARQVVHNENPVACGKQRLGDMATDEPCSSGDTDDVAHAGGSPLGWIYVVEFEPMQRRFYQRSTELVARSLLGKLLVRTTKAGLAAVRLTELEAYLGPSDPACHTFGGRRTPRTEVMWGPAGFSYVYLVYGMHHCLNVVTVGEGHGEAVLVRGGLPVLGEELMRERRAGGRGLSDGPGKLCQALSITRTDNGLDLCDPESGLYLGDDGTKVPLTEVRSLPRVGVAYAGEAATWPLRFLWQPPTTHPVTE